MIIKKFQAKTEAEAVANAKKEMGENVVVMSSRNVKRKGLFSFFKKPLVEITVGMEESEKQMQEAFSAIAKTTANSPRVLPPNSYTSKVSEAKKEEEQVVKEQQVVSTSTASTKVIEKRLDSLQSLLEQQFVKESEDDEFAKDSDDPTMTFLKLIYKTLIDNEVDEKYVDEIMEEMGKIDAPKSNVDVLLANIYQKMILKFGEPVTIPLNRDKQSVIYFIGPTGVGKTTTIAKLASQLCVNHKKKVALLTTDTYRIAAAEQLRTYASILEVPFRVIYTEEEMATALSDFKDYDYIMVDTAGHSHNNEEQRNSVSKFLQCTDDTVEKDVYLVLSSTTKYKDLLAIADTYLEVTDYKLIFTKLDETTALGNLLNLKLYTGADLSYITCGQNVPDDIEEFNAQATVKNLLGGKK